MQTKVNKILEYRLSVSRLLIFFFNLVCLVCAGLGVGAEARARAGAGVGAGAGALYVTLDENLGFWIEVEADQV